MLEQLAYIFHPLAIRQFDLLLVVSIVAIASEAMSGALAAGRRNMDFFGVAVIGFVTALGGGTIRDVVLGNYPLNWTQHPENVYLAVLASLATTVIARFMHRMKGLFLMLDAIGLAAFSLIGCNVALQFDYPVVVVIMAGMLTGISGGILRDVLCNQVPVVFHRELYAIVSLFICALFLGLRSLGVDTDLNTLVCFIVGLGFRMLALRFSWKLPTFSYHERWD